MNDKDYKINLNQILPHPLKPLATGWCIEQMPQVRISLRTRRFYRHGWQSWSFSGWLEMDTPLHPPGDPVAILMNEDQPYANRLVRTSAGFTVLEDNEGKLLLIGALDLEGRVLIEEDHLLARYEQGHGNWFLATGTAETIFDAYAQALAERCGRFRHTQAPRIWCSWYSLYYFISETLLLKVLRELNDLPFDVFQIDDGWQQTVGDWQPNRKFPHGMAEMARQIRQSGRLAGLWLAPFLVHERAPLFRQHPDWLLRDERGRLVLATKHWGGKVYALDVTHPAVQDWLGALMRQVRAWGYDYVKLDFLYAAALPAVRHREMSREAAYRMGLEILRQNLGDAFLLLCGAPILPSLGLCDAIRISPDVAAYWLNRPYQQIEGWCARGVKNAIHPSLHRLWLKPLVHPDPDVAYFRHRALYLSEAQKSLQRDLAWICDYRATSDLPWWLTPAEREALRTFWEQRPKVQKLDAHRFLLDDRLVDFRPALEAPPRSSYPKFLAGHLGFLQDALQLGWPAILASRFGK